MQRHDQNNSKAEDKKYFDCLDVVENKKKEFKRGVEHSIQIYQRLRTPQK